MRPLCPQCEKRPIRIGGNLCNDCTDSQMRRLREPEAKRIWHDRDHRGEHKQLRTVMKIRWTDPARKHDELRKG